MKLIFPNGEHATIELKLGKTYVGNAAGSDVRLTAAGIAATHCEIIVSASSASLHVPNAANNVALNGRQVISDSAIKPGDIILFGKIGARVLAMKNTAVLLPVTKPVTNIDAEGGPTRVRQTMPKFLLRGVSGDTFGKSFSLQGTMIVGRQSDSDICIPSDEISRQHAKLQVMPDAIVVEDMGSANGTFINGKRIQTGMLRPGEELRLDTVRFILVAPQLEITKIGQAAPVKKAKPANSISHGGLKWGVVAVIILAAIISGLILSGIIRL